MKLTRVRALLVIVGLFCVFTGCRKKTDEELMSDINTAFGLCASHETAKVILKPWE